MRGSETPTDLSNDRGPIADPAAFAGASAADVFARAEADGAPFAESEEPRGWVADGPEQLS